MPPWDISLWYFAVLPSKNSAAWAISAASSIRLSLMSEMPFADVSPNFRLEAMSPENSTAFWGT